MIEISEYLEQYVKATKRGTCRACGKGVQWCLAKLRSHKRSSCPGATVAEKELFRLQNSSVSLNVSSGSTDDATTSAGELTAEKKALIDTKITKLFCRTGMSFRIADSAAFRDVIQELNPSYAKQLPKSRTISGVLLDEVYNKSFKQLTDILNDSNELTLISDGWTNLRGEHIVNFLIKAPSQPSMFLKSIDTSGISQTAENIAEAIISVIEEVGSGKFVALVMDNANVVKAAGRKVEEKFPNISSYGCAAHCLNLLVKDILETHASILSEVSKVIKMINNHHRARALFDAARKTDNTARKLMVAVNTRWFSHYQSLKSVQDSKYVLIKLCDENTDELKQITPTAAAVITCIKTASFWARLAKAVKAIEFPVEIIGEFLGCLEFGFFYNL